VTLEVVTKDAIELQAEVIRLRQRNEVLTTEPSKPDLSLSAAHTSVVGRNSVALCTSRAKAA
jgi:hypothetical protein